MKNLKQFKPLLRYLKEDKKKVILVIITIIITSLIGLSYGYLVGMIVESATNLKLKIFLIYLAIYFFVEVILDIQIKRRSRGLLKTVKFNLTRKISYEVFYKTMKLPAKAFEEKTSGEIINRVTSDTETITDMMDRLLGTIIEIVGSIIVLFYIFYNSWIVGLEIILFLIIVIIITIKFTPKIKKYHEDIKKDSDNYIANVNQSVMGIREIKTLGIRLKLSNSMKKLVENVFDKRKNLMLYENNYWMWMRTINCTYEIAMFLTCGLLVYFKLTTLGFFISMTYYLYRYMWVVSEMSEFIPNYQKVLVSVARINEIINNEIYQDDVFGNVNKIDIRGRISFKDVTFGYDKDNILLNNFNIDIPTNKKVAIIGKSGQGKSTLFNLITRIFDPISGDIYIDDIELKNFTEKALRKNISIIRQDPFIFNKTIKENFEMLDSDITYDDIRKYAKIAKIDEYIMTLPDAYDTIIGEGGVNLSGGQKQRLAIARSLIKNSKIILFDEATSALDNESQEYIKKSIDTLSKDHTVIIIAHRLSTIIDADIIYVVDEGKVKASGTHEELLKSSDIYKRLYSVEITKNE